MILPGGRKYKNVQINLTMRNKLFEDGEEWYSCIKKQKYESL